METDIAGVTTPSADNDVTRTAFWHEHIDAWREAGQTQREYARQHELSIARFTYWKSKFYPSTTMVKDRFVPVRLSATPNSVRVTHPNGMVIECPAGTDVPWLRLLLGLADAS
jgi:hypothetical protein